MPSIMDSGGPSGSRAVTDSIRPDADDPWARRNILSFGTFLMRVIRKVYGHLLVSDGT